MFSLGGKVNPVGRMLMIANVIFQTNQAGLHAKPVPLIGLSYTFDCLNRGEGRCSWAKHAKPFLCSPSRRPRTQSDRAIGDRGRSVPPRNRTRDSNRASLLYRGSVR